MIPMIRKVIPKKDFNNFLKIISIKGEVFIPVQDGTKIVWAPALKADNLTWNFSNTDLSPKDFFFPQTQNMLEFHNDPRNPQGLILHEVQAATFPKILLNMRPCDSRAFSILDQVFLHDQQRLDVYWQEKRNNTMILTLACNNPCSTCFCTSMGLDPHSSQGSDVLMQDMGDRLLLTPQTESGKDLIADLTGASQDEVKQAEALKDKAIQMISTDIRMENIVSSTVLDLYNSAVWKSVHESCLNCGVCTYFCPTCHCFDIQDETQGKYGRRIRNWDSCMSPLFTLHASGHNPRGTKMHRVRQRFMHKFKYMPEKLSGVAGCTGCGRCIVRCPVNIDVRSVLNQMNS